MKKNNGVFFPKKNSTVLAIKLNWLLEKDFVRKVIGANARKTIEKYYDWQNTVDKIKLILEGF